MSSKSLVPRRLSLAIAVLRNCQETEGVSNRLPETNDLFRLAMPEDVGQVDAFFQLNVAARRLELPGLAVAADQEDRRSGTHNRCAQSRIKVKSQREPVRVIDLADRVKSVNSVQNRAVPRQPQVPLVQNMIVGCITVMRRGDPAPCLVVFPRHRHFCRPGQDRCAQHLPERLVGQKTAGRGIFDRRRRMRSG